MPSTYHVGQRLSFKSFLCTVRYIGPVEGTDKEWLGIEWDDPKRGKHNGVKDGKRHFKCKLGGNSLVLMSVVSQAWD